MLQWLGDSLDGTLARVRRIERPRYGYYLDHLVDAFATVAVGVGLGLSPYMLLSVGLAVALVYLLLSINVYLEAQTLGRFGIGYGRIGPTEARIALIARQHGACARGRAVVGGRRGRAHGARPVRRRGDRGDAGRPARPRGPQPAGARRARARRSRSLGGLPLGAGARLHVHVRGLELGAAARAVQAPVDLAAAILVEDQHGRAVGGQVPVTQAFSAIIAGHSSTPRRVSRYS